MAADGAFADLRKLADWFATEPSLASPRPGPASGPRAAARAATQLERLACKLGALAVPLLGRELRGPDPRRREAARDALACLARATDPRGGLRERVVGELRGVAVGATVDDAKVCALGLLAELGEHATARFADPSAMRRRSALALAGQLATPADVASAADLMLRQLDPAELAHMLEALVEVAPAAGHRLTAELGARLDLPPDRRAQLAALVEAAPPAAPPALPPAAARRAPRPAQVAVLVDAAARLVVIASRKVPGERCCRRWAVLITASGRIDDCLHEEDAADPAAPGSLVASLCADGYRVASTDAARARDLVATAARVTARDPARLSSAYYLGRDLLDLGDAHLGGRGPADSAARALGRAVELLAEGDAARARALLLRCDPDHSDAAGALGAALLALGEDAAAAEALGRAIAAEPEWPLHHWNLAIALQRTGDAAGCYQALRRFVAASAAPSGLYADPDQPGRVACAERMLVELERAARLDGRSLGPRRRQTRRKRARP